MKQRLLRLLALLLALCLLCGCSDYDITSLLSEDETDAATPTEEDDETPPEMAADTVLQDAETLDVLQLGYQESFGLNPFTTTSLCNRAIISLLYEPLYVVNARFEAEPVLAASSTVSEDGLTTTVTIRRGVTFHNGRPLTAKDVVYSYELAKESDYYGNRFFHIDEFTAENDYTVAIQTDTVYEAVSLLLDFPVVQAGTGDQAVPIGTGPFVYDDSYELLPYSGWWQEEFPIPCNSVRLTPCTTSANIRDQFEYGQINLVWSDPNSAAYARFHNDSESWYSPTTVMQFIGFNSNKKAFSHSAARACVTYAIDREAIISEYMGGSAEAASLPASPLSSCYDQGLAAAYDYDLDDFQATLDRGEIRDYGGDGVLDVYHKGNPVPLEGTMIVAAGNTQRRLTAERIANDLNRLGFDITVKFLEQEAFLSALRYGNYDLYFSEVRLSANFDLGSFFRNGGSAAYGGMENSSAVDLCAGLLENSGNAYDLHKRVMDQGYLCPISFKSYTVYTTRGATQDLEPALDWVVHGS